MEYTKRARGFGVGEGQLSRFFRRGCVMMRGGELSRLCRKELPGSFLGLAGLAGPAVGPGLLGQLALPCILYYSVLRTWITIHLITVTKRLFPSQSSSYKTIPLHGGTVSGYTTTVKTMNAGANAMTGNPPPHRFKTPSIDSDG